ncbi:hypothetical protein [Altererythrobacter lauratis]|uniref:Uncharacterized protein n=1 Tax=Alteraurantiacibacter lauratis TaxID=2054627 RepID=A0ABV7ECD2_9SPHN
MIDHADSALPPADETSARPRPFVLALLSLLAVFALGAAFGIGSTMAEDGATPVALLLLAVAVSIAGLTAWAAFRLYARATSGPESPRVRFSRMLLIAGGAMGLVMGIAFSVATDTTGSADLFGSGPLPGWLAALTIAVYVLIGGGLTLAWLRSIDEHEMQANNAGALAGLCTYLFVEPSWWLGARGGFLPDQQPMVTFLLVLTVYTAVWLWHRSR